ncbi:MAG: BlaI/MecI/CopY family transcriptional regulator [Acidobacteria bacterium]|nr:BlaI/MecI/CopY family transcriptional regulator [Acidobacteriota bacterium]
MPRPRSKTLTDAELRLMEALWQLGPATVADVVEALPKQEKVAYNTVLTTLRILEDKGYVAHKQRGRAFVYEALVGRDQARRSTVRHLMSKFFDNSPAALVLNVLENEQIDAEELERLRALIDRRTQ